MTRPSATVRRTTPGSSMPSSGVLAEADASSDGSTRQRAAGSNTTRSAAWPMARLRSLPDDLGRPDRERRHQPRELEGPRLDGGEPERERRLEPDHPGRGLVERHQLALRGVRRVIGRDRVDGPVRDAGQQRQRVGSREASGGLTRQ